MQYSRQETIERLASAAGTGQVIIVNYHGGSAPGHKRQIVVIEINDDEMQVREIPDRKPRTYLLSKTHVVDGDDPAPWKPEFSGKMTAISPVDYFRDWEFPIRTYHYEALGVVIRDLIDKERTADARRTAIDGGMTAQLASRRIKIMRREHAIASPPAYAFDEGDMFYKGAAGGENWIQVIGQTTIDGARFVDVYLPLDGNLLAYRLRCSAFADVLRTGFMPASRYRLSRLKIKQETIYYRIAPD